MKKIIIYITVLSIIFALSGCGKKDPADAETTAASTSVSKNDPDNSHPEEATTPIYAAQEPMTSVYLPIQVSDTTAQDGTVIFRQGQQSMVLIAEDPDVADRIILDFLSRTDSDSDIRDTIESARTMYANGYNYLPLWQQTAYAPARVDQSILSLYGYSRTYLGGVHPDTVCRSVTYDMLTGNALTLPDILLEGISMDTLCTMVCTALEARSSNLFPDYATLVEELFQKSITEYSEWYLSSEGLCFYFSPYEIAAYSANDIVVTLPYNKLTGTLQDAYFPAEQDIAHGVLNQSAFDDEFITLFTQIAEVELGATGRKVILHTDYSIHNIRIEQTVPSIGSNEYNETRTIFGAAALTPGDAIVITIPEGMEVSVSYTAYGSTITEPV